MTWRYLEGLGGLNSGTKNIVVIFDGPLYVRMLLLKVSEIEFSKI